MNLPLAALLFWSVGAAIGAGDEAESKAVKVQQLYDKAFHHYSSGEYDEAIKLWDDILRLDPAQKTARQMIKDVSEDLKKKNASRVAQVYAHIKDGRYRSALSGLETLLGDESHIPVSPALQTQLEEIVAIVPAVPAKTKPWRLAATAINAAIGQRQDLKLSYNALRYARELNDSEEAFKRLLDWFLAKHPDFSNSDNVTPGMSLLEYKKYIALDYMYAGKHHLAVGVLNEALALEPDDLVSLKRLGTAYYSLGLNEKAREAWKKALVLSPNDAQLKKFLQKLGNQPSRRAAR